MGRPLFRQLPEAHFTASPALPIGGVPEREVGASAVAVPETASASAPRLGASAGAARRRRAAELYREHGAAVYRRCLRLLGHPEEARDATQEVFARLVQNIAALERRETLLPWMYRVATNHCLNLLRDRGGRVPDAEPGAGEDGGASAPSNAAELTLARAILARFDTGTQAIAVAILVDGMDCEELARVLGISRRTVARKVERFLEKARGLTEDQGPATWRRSASAAGASGSSLRTTRSGV